jgi:hypothetical protein
VADTTDPIGVVKLAGVVVVGGCFSVEKGLKESRKNGLFLSFF